MTSRFICVALLLLGCGQKRQPNDGAQAKAHVSSTSNKAPQPGGGQEEALPQISEKKEPRGRVLFVLEKKVWWMEARRRGTLVNVSKALDTFSKGVDELPGVSKNGEWLTVTTSRFGCAGYPCLAIFPRDIRKAAPVKVRRKFLHPVSRAIPTADGKTLFFGLSDGPHKRDIYRVTRRRASSNRWSKPELLTKHSPYQFHEYPSISPAGDKLVFNCGDRPYGEEGTAICGLSLKEKKVYSVLGPQDNPLFSGQDFALHHPDIGYDGAIYFEADWGGERIWRLLPGKTQAELIGEAFSNDNSPCTLPDGRLASLWLGDPKGQGHHELKIMKPFSDDALMMTPPHRDVVDIGLVCSE